MVFTVLERIRDFSFGIIFSVFGLFVQEKREPEPPCVQIANRLINDFASEMEREFQVECSGSGGSMPFDIQQIDVMFYYDKKLGLVEARKLLVTLTQRLAKKINDNEQIRPYLREYPFPVSRTCISIRFPDKSKEDLEYIESVANVRDLIFYRTEKSNFEEEFEEPYAEAFRLVKTNSENQGAALVKRLGPPKHVDFSQVYREEFAVLESKRPEQPFRDLKELSEAEILGIKNIDPTNLADVINELIDGYYTPGFDKAFLQHVAEVQKTHPNGRYIEYWENGQIKFDATFKNGIPDGHFHGWYFHGQDAFKGFHRAGVRAGTHIGFFWTKYHTSNLGIGRLFNYNEAGVFNGVQSIDFEKSRSYAGIMRYHNGILEGDVRIYNDEVKEIDHRVYRDGKRVLNMKAKR